MEETEEDRDKPATGREKFVWYSLMTLVSLLLIADILLKLIGGYGVSPQMGGFLFYLIVVIVLFLGVARLNGWVRKFGDKGI